ncbi:helix-turn-helix transcriptional regulator [Thermodesulfovibrio sp. 3907-1M]|uniref:helix-turn-helix transcriptional regulator n=1 Tax=Thermodesulfovibrio autotrophicus TaxID=3118333 RepID=UPI00338FAEBF
MEFERLACIIKFARLKRGLTQEQVAKKVGITTSYVTSLENSIRTSKNTAKVILHSLGVHLAVIDD